MKVLITNRALDRRAGTELYVRDLALGLKAHGHDVICFAPRLGGVARDIAASGIEVTDDISSINEPDVIHAQHHTAAALAFMQFPKTPAVFVCHGVKPWPEAPLARFPNIQRYIAVDAPCRNFLVDQHHIPEDQIDLVLNGVDLDRFKHAEPALLDQERQKQALLISNIAQPVDTLPFATACAAHGISLDVAGSNTQIMDRPENDLPRYGLVFAKARAAIEAMASGCAVLLADYGKTGALVTSDNYDVLRPANFGFSVIQDASDPVLLEKRLMALDWSDAAKVSQRIREEASFSNTVDQYLEIYSHLKPVRETTQMADVQAYLSAILPQLEERDELAARLYHETSSRIDRDREVARLIRQVENDPDSWAELKARSAWLDPNDED